MKIESPAFTMDDVKAFMSTYRDRERHLLADRLQRISDRLAEIGPQVSSRQSDEAEWNAHEVLAHLAVVSKFYGVLVHRIASGKLTDMNLLEAVNLRDAAGKQMSELDPAELLRMTLADHQRTINTLHTVDPASLQNSARVDDGTTMTAEEVARLPLITHMEMHVEQLEKLLASR
ncbi:MAG: DinB family protein [Chloroflexi bacterium]|nr:MAG: DinB family protein [Chloroflexota bacterium]